MSYLFGHTAGDRTTVAVSFGAFNGQWTVPRDTWSLGELGVETGVRPSPTSSTVATIELGYGSWEREPKRGSHGVTALVAQWRLGVAHDDPPASTLGAFAELHGSLGGSVSHAGNEDGSRVHVIGLAIGPTYVRR